jgi:hypothetical protein
LIPKEQNDELLHEKVTNKTLKNKYGSNKENEKKEERILTGRSI